MCATDLKQDADAKIHKRFRKVNDHFSGVVDGHRTDGQIRFLHHPPIQSVDLMKHHFQFKR